MRIVSFRWRFVTLGGIERVVERLSVAHLEAGHEASVVTTAPCEVAFDQRLAVHTAPVVSVRGRLVSPGLPGYFMRNRPDVLHVHDSPGRLGPLHLSGARRRVWSPYFNSPQGSGSERSHWRRSFRAALQALPDMVFVSETERFAFVEFVGRFPGRSTVVVPGPSWPDGTVLPAGPRDLVLAVGRLVPSKATDLVVEACARAGCLAQLRVVGDGPEREALALQIHRLGADPDQVLLGQASDAETWSLFGRASAYVSMSPQEAFGLSVWDAVLSGAAVVASDLPAHQEILARDPSARHRLVAVGDVADAGRALEAALSAPVATNAVIARTWADAADEVRRFAMADEVSAPLRRKDR